MGKTNTATTKAKAKEPVKAKTAKTDKKADKKVEKKVEDKKVERTSNGSAKVVAKAAPAKAVPAAPVKPAAAVITYNCPFPADELVKWRQILLAKRHEVTDDIAGLVKDAMDAEDGHTTPNHIAERGSDADLQDLSLGVAGEEKDVVWQIDRALRKIDTSRPVPYGLCEHTKEPIPRTRLQLIPWTPLSIEGATHMEKNSLTLEDLLIED